MKFFTTSRISENIHETPEGYLVCVGVSVARTGEMFYAPGETPIAPGVDGKVRIIRAADEVFRPETIASFQAKPITIFHPKDFVSAETWSELSHGVVQNVRRGKGETENDLVADLLITDSIAIDLVKNGLREVSCGYEAEYVETGIGQGFQRKIIGNHIALVDEGRAGAKYAINDHKGKGIPMTLGERIKAIFAKAQDDALKVAEEATAPVVTATKDAEPKEDKKDDKAKDAMGMGYDELVKCMKDVSAKIDAMGGKKDEPAKDATTAPTQNEPAKVVAKDEPVAASLEDRLKKLEEMVASLMSEESGDADPDAEEEGAEDNDFEESNMVGDTAARVEILAPGMKAEGKDAKKKALIAAYATTDGKAVIEQFTGGKALDVKDEKLVDALFVGASEVLKAQRSNDLAQTKVVDSAAVAKEYTAMSPEKMNEMNAKHYGIK